MIINLSGNLNESNISITITESDALVEDQGYTYNQVGFSYNQVGVDYGGIYNQNQDVIPLMLTVTQVTPSIAGYADFYASGQAESSGQLMGILGLTYPTKGVLE